MTNKHHCFRYFTLNTTMGHRALQNGRIYVHQNPNDGHLIVDELRDKVRMVMKLCHQTGYSTFRGTCQFWQKQRSRLIVIMDTLTACPMLPLHLVLLTYSGQNWLIYLMLMILKAVLLYRWRPLIRQNSVFTLIRIKT